jgi:hypothetical protein
MIYALGWIELSGSAWLGVLKNKVLVPINQIRNIFEVGLGLPLLLST